MKLLSLCLLMISVQAFAHSGRTDSSGCHHETRTGGYHCHRGDDAPVKVERNPASELKTKNAEKKHKSDKTISKL